MGVTNVYIYKRCYKIYLLAICGLRKSHLRRHFILLYIISIKSLSSDAMKVIAFAVYL